MNVCGYDQELASSSPIRAEVRADLVAASKTPEAAAAAKEMCNFYADHRQDSSGHQLAQYVSLALSLGDPPAFAPKSTEADMPPDASYLLGFVPVLKRYAAAARLHSIWLKHQSQYTALIDQYPRSGGANDQFDRYLSAHANWRLRGTFLYRLPRSHGRSGRSQFAELPAGQILCRSVTFQGRHSHGRPAAHLPAFRAGSSDRATGHGAGSFETDTRYRAEGSDGGGVQKGHGACW